MAFLKNFRFRVLPVFLFSIVTSLQAAGVEELKVTQAELDQAFEKFSKVKTINVLSKKEDSEQATLMYSIKLDLKKIAQEKVVLAKIQYGVLEESNDKYTNNMIIDMKYDRAGTLIHSKTDSEFIYYLGEEPNGFVRKVSEVQSTTSGYHLRQKTEPASEKDYEKEIKFGEKEVKSSLLDELFPYVIFQRKLAVGQKVSFSEVGFEEEEVKVENRTVEVVKNDNSGMELKVIKRVKNADGYDVISAEEYFLDDKGSVIKSIVKNDLKEETVSEYHTEDVAFETLVDDVDFNGKADDEPSNPINEENFKKGHMLYLFKGSERGKIKSGPSSSVLQFEDLTLLRSTSQLKTDVEEEATKTEKHHPVDAEIPDDWVSHLSEDFKGLDFEEKLDKIAIFLRDKIKYADTSDYYMSISDIIKNGIGDCNAFSDVAAALLRRLGIPARVVGGYHFSEKNYGGHAWVEAQNPDIKKWFLLEPQSGHKKLKESSFRFVKLFSGPTFGDFRKSYRVPGGLQSVPLSEKEYEKILQEKGYKAAPEKTLPQKATSQESEHLHSEDD